MLVISGKGGNNYIEGSSVRSISGYVCRRTGNANALISLIKHGANVNVVYKHTGYSLLMKALDKHKIPNQYLIIVLLLKNGADVNIISNNSKTALYLAKIYYPRYINLLKRFGAEY